MCPISMSSLFGTCLSCAWLQLGIGGRASSLNRVAPLLLFGISCGLVGCPLYPAPPDICGGAYMGDGAYIGCAEYMGCCGPWYWLYMGY